MTETALTAKEKIVLGEIVRNFIETALPVSSSLVAQNSRVHMSPATVRNIMAGLEERGYIYQPHTSAGRVPQTPGYRAYVDTLMKKARLSSDEKEKIVDLLEQGQIDTDDVLKEVTRILAHLSRQLGIMVSPKVEQGTFQRMDLIPLSVERLLIVITVDSGFVKTLTMEIPAMVSGDKLQLVNQILNERLCGMKIADIRRRFAAIVKDIQSEESGLVRLFSQSADRMFDFHEEVELYFMGTHHILQSQDFPDVSAVSAVMELLETRDKIVEVLDKSLTEKPASVKIGEEIDEQKMRECSIVAARYQIGRITGVVGVIGPKRMNYSKVVSIVEFTARKITDMYGKN